MAIEELLGQLTLEEKCSLLSGSAFWYTQAVERLGIRKLMLTDGPHGLRIDMGEMPFQDLLGKGECVLRNVILPGNGYGWYYKTWEE